MVEGTALGSTTMASSTFCDTMSKVPPLRMKPPTASPLPAVPWVMPMLKVPVLLMTAVVSLGMLLALSKRLAWVPTWPLPTTTKSPWPAVVTFQARSPPLPTHSVIDHVGDAGVGVRRGGAVEQRRRGGRRVDRRRDGAGERQVDGQRAGALMAFMSDRLLPPAKLT